MTSPPASGAQNSKDPGCVFMTFPESNCRYKLCRIPLQQLFEMKLFSYDATQATV
jgi:hypothetical protein